MLSAVTLRGDAVLEELAWSELFRRRFPAEREHPLTLSAKLFRCRRHAHPIDGLPEIKPGDDLAAMIVGCLKKSGRAFEKGDVPRAGAEIVSKSEGRIRKLADVVAGPEALRMADEWPGKDPRQLQVVLDETVRIVRWQRGVLIVETKHGFVCANAGVDHSNAGAPDTLILLPVDPDASADADPRAAQEGPRASTSRIVITDTFGRAWREGHLNVAIGISGLPRSAATWASSTPRATSCGSPRSRSPTSSPRRRSS